MAPTGLQKFILVLLALILPPLPILLVNNFKFSQRQFLFSVVLTIFGHFPGLLYSLYYLFFELPEGAFESNQEGYIRIQDEESAVPGRPVQAQSPPRQGGQKLGVAPHERPVNGRVNEGSSSSENPPSYTDIVDNNAPRDTKDNKVQHD